MYVGLSALLLSALPLGAFCSPSSFPKRQAHIISRQAGNGSLPIYKDASRSINDRVEDLLQRMTLEEKAGQLFHTQLNMPTNYTYVIGSNSDELLNNRLISHFNLVGTIGDARRVAEFVNSAQERALNTRLGIPITISSDPRHSFTDNIGTGFQAGTFSEWPESLGLAAIRDVNLVKKFAEIAREEYIAVGLRSALHPQVDLSTEPRWARIAGTWGEDAALTSELLVAYITGFQGEKLGPRSVTTVTKHFPGGGAMENGEDSHFTYGKNQTYPGNNFEHHLIPFKAAIAAGARQMMPYYSRPIGTKYEPVGFSFNRQIVTELLREELGFEGIVVTDWGLITDTYILGQSMPARAWGLEYLTETERVVRILQAGCDQFGGENRTDLIIKVVQDGLVPEERLDISIRRLLREKFVLGLFENPYADPEAAERMVGNEYFVKLGRDAQRRAYTLLTNKDSILPLKYTSHSKFYIEGFNATFLEARNLTVVDTPEDADFALLRYNAPFEPRPGGFESRYHAGSLEFSAKEKERQAAIYSAVPTIVDIKLDRPAAIPEIAEQAAALFGSYGSGTEAFLDVVFGISEPEGKLPFDLPRSDAAVRNGMEDVPFDTRNPVFKFGHGLRYASVNGHEEL